MAEQRKVPQPQICTLQNQCESQFLETMNRAPIPVREKVAAHRQRLREAGRVYVNTDLPIEMLDCLDEIKSKRGVASRAQLFEEALRLLIEKETRA